MIVIVIVITTYHAVYWSYRASRADGWFLPRSIPWVPGLPEVAHSMTEDPEDRGHRATRLWGQWQLRSKLARLFAGGKGARHSNAAA